MDRNRAWVALAAVGLLALLPVGVRAQAAPAAQPLPRPQDLEPGVDTSRATPADGSPTAPAPPAKAVRAPAAAGVPKAPAAPKAAAAAPGTKPSGAATKGVDRLNLEGVDVTGNSELPKVLYIVPWKRSELGDMVGRPVNSLLDEVLQPLDRDVFRRQNRYYDALQPQGDASKADAAPDSGLKR
ncbi:MAG: hypothetical protein JSS29_07270 [Proteobacteria bacterium]|nr:hypothetical protein [Pseudomonadota bacterium]